MTRCVFTVSSAGGRRGAQMATFDIGHPDVMDFIRAKRENGRLRQFNLSADQPGVHGSGQNNRKWDLAFPISAKEAHSDGLDPANSDQVVWREWPYKTDTSLTTGAESPVKSTKPFALSGCGTSSCPQPTIFAEPGFILVDKVNR